MVAKSQKIPEPTVHLSQWYKVFTWVAGLLMLGVGIWIVGWQIDDLHQEAMDMAQEELELRATTLELRLRQTTDHLERTRETVETLLSGSVGHPPPPWQCLRDGADGAYVYLADEPGCGTLAGGLFAVGTIEAVRSDPNLQRRIGRYILLMAFLEIEYRIRPGLSTTWFRRFSDSVVLYPRISPADFRAAYQDVTVGEQLSLDTLGMEFWHQLRADLNPRGLAFWTPPYLDILGKGLTVTYAAPVREDGEVVGMVGTDVVLGHLVNLLQSPRKPGGRYLLVAKNDDTVLNVAVAQPSPGDPIPTLEDFIPAADQDARYERRVPVNGTPWELIWTVDRWDLFIDLLPETMVPISLLALLSTLVMIGHLTVRRRYIQPAIDLVRHMEAEASGERLEKLKMPGDWQRWFDSVTDSFKLRHIAQSFPVVVGRLRWDGSGEPILVFVGDGFHTLFGIDEDVELVGFPFFEAVHQDDHEILREALRSSAESGGLTQADFRIRPGPDGERWLRGSATAREDDRTTFDCMAIDITPQIRAEEHRRRFETRMQQAQKAESLGVLAGGVAHDFNNILMGIIGSAELAEMDLPPESELREHLREIIQGGRRASELAHQMLAYAGRGRLTLEMLSVNQLVNDLQSLMEASIPKLADLRLELTTEVPIVEGDPTQLRQVLMNLVINSAEAIGDVGGTITIATSARDIDRQDLVEAELSDELPPGSYTSLEVRDTGSGMDNETRLRIFDPFFSTKFLGRGLGLASVLGIVRGHGGAIGVSSEPERGTTFQILLPAHSEDTGSFQPTPWPQHVRPREFRGTALLVDDEPTVRKVAGLMLRRLGFEVVTAEDGIMALDILSSASELPSLVLLDYSMPRMDGPQTLVAIRAAWPDLPVLLCSGYDATEMGHEELLEARAFLQKPIRMAELAEALDAILNDRSPSTEGAEE